MRACLADHAPDGVALVTVEIVHDDHVTWLECWHLFDISLEAQPVDRATTNAGGGQAVVAKGADKVSMKALRRCGSASGCKQA